MLEFAYHLRRRLMPVLCAGLLVGCSSGGGGDTDASALSPAAALGEKIFADKSLSASGQMACATCHDPARAHAGNTAVVAGGADLTTPGFRNPPSLRYANLTPAFHFDDGPVGGFDRDGRAATLSDQAHQPLLAAFEMANADAAAFAARLRAASYASAFAALFGPNIFDDGTAALDRATYALQQYQMEDAEFHSYSSKYDAFLTGRVQLSEQELRGLKLFNDPQKGNCAACHPSSRGADGSLPLFTDFSYDNLGVPRNFDIPANADPSYYDLGLCGPDRVDLLQQSDLCGAFKVPTLRNITLTGPYFHNGRFATLKEALQFYVRRDTNPEEFYPLGTDGQVQKFNDLPAQYHVNVNITEVPYNRKPGDQPDLSDSEIDDVIVFLGTLTDGYSP
ncbi:MAG: c-type cytochrome [Nevskia sp.]|nr:c-type cytochrome [Nevskia sp.]